MASVHILFNNSSTYFSGNFAPFWLTPAGVSLRSVHLGGACCWRLLKNCVLIKNAQVHLSAFASHVNNHGQQVHTYCRNYGKKCIIYITYISRGKQQQQQLRQQCSDAPKGKARTTATRAEALATTYNKVKLKVWAPKSRSSYTLLSILHQSINL